jgi:hypothetical protein
MVEFTTADGKVRINPALVAALYQVEGVEHTNVVLSDGLNYYVPGTLAEVDDKLTNSYTDIRYVAFVLEALCAHLKVEIVPPSQLKVEVITPTEPKEENPT